jgi:hypothetical protein
MSAAPEQAFAPSYAQARDLFLQAAHKRGLAVDTHPHPLPGRDGETMAMDVVWDGPAQASRVLIVSSACHGVEGHCGSGVQVDALRRPDWRPTPWPADVAVLWVHALNPYGFSHGRRTTQENADLNRNFHRFDQALPDNPGYAQIHDWLIPQTWPPTPANEAALQNWVEQHGKAAFQQAVSGGQHSHPEGLFFSGLEPTWSHTTLRQVLRAHAGHARHVGWIDLHTGLGPSGVGERIFACKDDAAALARTRAWWGSDATPITSIYDGSSTSARLTGLMWSAVEDECPQAQYTGIALEYGTVPWTETLFALRADHWLALHPEASDDQAQHIHRELRRVFYTETDTWKRQILTQARQALAQGIEGLAGA